MTDKKNEVVALESISPDMTACMDKFSRTFEATGPMQAMGGMFPF